MNGSDTLSILDGESSGSLQLVHQWQLPARGLGVASLGPIVCAVYDSPGAVHSCSLDLIDISNPYNPKLLCTKSIGADMGVFNAILPIYPSAFIITTNKGFVGIDITDPTKPIPLTPYRTERAGEILSISLTSIDDWRGRKLSGVRFRDYSRVTIPVEPWVDQNE